MKHHDDVLKNAARSRRSLRIALATFGIGAAASLGLFAASLSSGGAPSQAAPTAPRSAPVATDKHAQSSKQTQSSIDAVDWSRVETVADPGPMAIGAQP